MKNAAATLSSSLLLLLLLESSSSSRHGVLSTFVGSSGLIVVVPAAPPPPPPTASRSLSPPHPPPPPPRFRLRRRRRDEIVITTTGSMRRRRGIGGGGGSALHGNVGVNDYFASFNNKNDDDDDDDGGDKNFEDNSSDSRNSNDGGGSGKRWTGKYLGHGRSSLAAEDERNNDGESSSSSSSSSSSEGGLFDVNDYFSSFRSNSNVVEDDVDDDDIVECEEKKQQQWQRGPQQQRQQPPPSSATPPPTTTRRKMTYDEIVAHNNARLCPKLLLTQRAIQSFIYLLEECRDPHSGRWIEDFLGTSNLGNYHGSGAINVTRHPEWDSALRDMMEQPNDVMIVSAKRRGRGHGGWSKNNPYLEERYVEFGIDIRPASLVRRLLAVRAQLASEFERDLEIVRMVDVTAVMDSYFRKLADSVAEDRCDAAAAAAATTRRGDDGRPRSSSSSSSSSSSFDRVSVDILTNFTEYQDGGGGDYDGGSSSSPSSPFRRGNFDLLYSLCTHAASHRLLREMQQSTTANNNNNNNVNVNVNDDVVAFQWFKRFYVDNAPLYFDGDQNFGRADDFIDALLRTPPTLVGGGGDANNAAVGLTDPMRVAERIIAARVDVASEWMGVMAEVEGDHGVLNDELFRVMMGRTMDESGDVGDVVDIREEVTLDELADNTGAFD